MLIPKAFGTCGNSSIINGVETKDELPPDLSEGKMRIA
jgi:hypothetical protein